MKPVTFHLPKEALADGARAMKPFYKSLMAGLKEEGIPARCVVHNRAQTAQVIDADAGFHVIDHGRIRHPRALNAGIAYVYPFWNMDPWGIRAFSSIGGMAFDPAIVDEASATDFFRRLRWRLVKKRQSRFPQPSEVSEDLPQGAISVFLQNPLHPTVTEASYLSGRDMVEAACQAAGGRAVIVKPNPKNLDVDAFGWLADLMGEWPNLRVSEANIHDILAVSAHVVTINSAVGFEALLYDLPVTLCGRADFHHLCRTAKTVADLKDSLNRGQDPQPVEAYFYWYFRMQCLAGGDDDVTSRFLARVSAQAFDF